MKDWKLALVVGGVALGGVAVGAQCFGARPAQAQVGPYTRCVVARQESVDTGGDGNPEAPALDHTIVIPAGWEPIGGGGQGGGGSGTYLGAVVLCHR